MALVNPNASDADFQAAMAEAAAQQSGGNPFAYLLAGGDANAPDGGNPFRAAPVGGNPFTVPAVNGAPMIPLAGSAPAAAPYAPSLESFAPGGANDSTGGNPFRVVPIAADHPAKHGFTYASDDYTLPGVPVASPAPTAASSLSILPSGRSAVPSFDQVMARYQPATPAPSAFDLAMAPLQAEAAGAPVPASAPAVAPPSEGASDDSDDVMPSAQAVPGAVNSPPATLPFPQNVSTPTDAQMQALGNAGPQADPSEGGTDSAAASFSPASPSFSLPTPRAIPDAPTYDANGVANGAGKSALIAAGVGLLLGGGRGALAAAPAAFGGYDAAANSGFGNELAAWKENAGAIASANANDLAGYKDETERERVANAAAVAAAKLKVGAGPPKPLSPVALSDVANSRNQFVERLAQIPTASGRDNLVRANLSSFDLWGLPKPPTKADGSLDLTQFNGIEPSVSPDTAAKIAADGVSDKARAQQSFDSDTMTRAYQALGSDRITDAGRAQAISTIQAIQQKYGGVVDPLQGKLYNQLSEADRDTYRLGLLRASLEHQNDDRTYNLGVQRENTYQTEVGNQAKANAARGPAYDPGTEYTIRGLFNESDAAGREIADANRDKNAAILKDGPNGERTAGASAIITASNARINAASLRQNAAKASLRQYGAKLPGGGSAGVASSPNRQTTSGRSVVVDP